HQFVPGWRDGRWGRAEPLVELLPADGGDVVPALLGRRRAAVRLDQTVALQPLQGGVDLADVEGPQFARPLLELLAQLQPVLGSLAQQRQQCVSHAHASRSSWTILGIIPSMVAGPRRSGAPQSMAGIRAARAAGRLDR